MEKRHSVVYTIVGKTIQNISSGRESLREFTRRGLAGLLFCPSTLMPLHLSQYLRLDPNPQNHENMSDKKTKKTSNVSAIFILLMEEIPNNHLGCIPNPVNNGTVYTTNLNWLVSRDFWLPSTVSRMPFLQTWPASLLQRHRFALLSEDLPSSAFGRKPHKALVQHHHPWLGGSPALVSLGGVQRGFPVWNHRT